MGGDQITIHAIVRAVDGGFADVEIEHGGCGRCHEEGGCGGQQLTQMFCGGPKTYRVENLHGAGIGDRVTVAIASGSVSRTANFAYILPLTVTIVGAALGASLGGDFSAMVGAGVGLCFTFLYIILHSRNDTAKASYRPHIISRF